MNGHHILRILGIEIAQKYIDSITFSSIRKGNAMGNKLTNLPCKSDKADVDQPELDCDTPEAAAGKNENDDVQKAELERKGVEEENLQPTESATKGGLAEKNEGQTDNVSPKKDNPDFEPEFDGDLAHVSWLPMKLFGNKKGF